MAVSKEEQQLMRRIEKRLMKGIVDYGLIEDGDHILVALSGGKDSLALLELLARRARIYKPRFTLHAVHVVMKNISYHSDEDYLREYATSCGVPFMQVETSFDPVSDTRKSPCFLCSWNRRKALFTVAQQLGCNKIALGHHQDDILHTTLLNFSFQGQFSTMPARLRMRKFPMTIIRPFCMVQERDLAAWAAMQEYQKQKKLCPYERDSHRSDMRNIFDQIEQMNPEARHSMWNALEREGKLVEE